MMTGMRTMVGSMRHAQRALTVAVHRGVLRPLVPWLVRLNDHPLTAKIANHPLMVWLDKAPRWMKLGTREWFEALGILYVVIVGAFLVKAWLF
jgi:hypothetical protein